MFASALAGGIAGGFSRTPPVEELGRHLVEGAFTYLDVVLVFFTATLFMNIVSESGGVDYVVRATVRAFGRKRVATLLVLMIIVLIPGALTGAGSVSLLVVGAPVATAFDQLGIPKKRAAAILFILAGLSAAAPPVNIWAMILCAGTAIPYVGFELVLGIPCLVLGAFTIFLLGWKRDTRAAEASGETLPAVAGMTWWRVLIPFVIFFGLVISGRLWPFSTPILGLSLEFSVAALAALLLSPRKLPVLTLSSDTVRRLLPLLSTMVIVGMLQQVMTATGVRGFLSYAVISMPLVLLFSLLPVIIPISEGVLTYGAAAIIGIPLVWFLDSLGYHATVVIAGLTLLWPLGDGLPPTALIGRLSNMVSGYRDSYWSFLRTTWLPWLVITAAGLLMILCSSKLAFLVRWSMGVLR
jgi:CitMHS family citrate-Mg2+:H+ or citrate-Ca2+:H+ symporter